MYQEYLMAEVLQRQDIDGKTMLMYQINFFNDSHYLYDFLIYIGHRVFETRINLFDGGEFKGSIEYGDISENGTDRIYGYCEENNYTAPFTFLFENEKGFTLTVIPKQNIMLAVTNNDETGVEDLEDVIHTLKTDYLMWIEAEHLFGYLSGKRSFIINLGVYDLTARMLQIPAQASFVRFYEDNLGWLEQHFSNISSDKGFWNTIHEEAQQELLSGKYH